LVRFFLWRLIAINVQNPITKIEIPRANHSLSVGLSEGLITHNRIIRMHIGRSMAKATYILDEGNLYLRILFHYLILAFWIKVFHLFFPSTFFPQASDGFLGSWFFLACIRVQKCFFLYYYDIGIGC